MNHTEAVQLITVLNRAGLVQALDGQGAVWATALADVAFTDAQQVARTMVATRTSRERWVTPGDIREAVQVLQASQPTQEHAIDWLIDADPDDPAAYIAALRANRRRPAFGHDAHPVEQLVDRAARSTYIPGPDSA